MSDVLLFDRIDSPLGELLLTGDGATLSGLFMSPYPKAPDTLPRARRDPRTTKSTCPTRA